MTKPKIEDFIPPGWYAAMDSDGGVLVSKDRSIRGPAFFYSDRCEFTRFAPEHAAMFDLSIFGPDWEKSLWQKPPELQPCPVCGQNPQQLKNYVKCNSDCCWVHGPYNDPDGSKWNRLRYEAE